MGKTRQAVERMAYSETANKGRLGLSTLLFE